MTYSCRYSFEACNSWYPGFRVYLGFRLHLGKNSKMFILVLLLTTFNMRNNFFEAARSLPELGLSLKSNLHYHVKLVQIPDTHSSKKKFVFGSIKVDRLELSISNEFEVISFISDNFFLIPECIAFQLFFSSLS